MGSRAKCDQHFQISGLYGLHEAYELQVFPILNQVKRDPGAESFQKILRGRTLKQLPSFPK